MSETKKKITIGFQDLVIEILKINNIHEGLWGLNVEFGLTATTFGFHDPDDSNSPKGPENGEPNKWLPTAIIPIKEIGIAPVAFLTNLSVDAAVVNPKPKTKTLKVSPKKS